MSDAPINHIDVGATLARLEEGASPIPVELSLASLAISMRRIAISLVNIDVALNKEAINGSNIAGELNQIRAALYTVGSNISGSPAAYEISRAIRETMKDGN